MSDICEDLCLDNANSETAPPYFLFDIAALQQTKMAVTVAFKGVVNKILSNHGV